MPSKTSPTADTTPRDRKTLETTIDALRVIRVVADREAVRAYESEDAGNHDASEGWANRAYTALVGNGKDGVTLLGVDYDAGPDTIEFLIHADEEEAARAVLRENIEVDDSFEAFDPAEGRSRFGDGHSGTITVWRDGDDVLLVEGTQPLG